MRIYIPEFAASSSQSAKEEQMTLERQVVAYRRSLHSVQGEEQHIHAITSKHQYVRAARSQLPSHERPLNALLLPELREEQSPEGS